MGDQTQREIALRVLRQRDSGQAFIEARLDRALAETALSAADRALARELVSGVVRWQRTLDWLIARKTPGRTQKPAVQVLLRLGLYQLFWLDRVPDHAALHETVELAKRQGFGPQAGFVNAVLRSYARERGRTRLLLAELKEQQPALGWSHPDWLYERWRARWSEPEVRRLLEWNNTPPKVFARLNTLRTTAHALIQRWQAEGVRFQARAWDWTGPDLVFELESPPPLNELPSFREGWFYVQDPSTLLAARLLDPQPGEHVLDLCAAPGGKTTFLAQLMENQGRVVAADLAPQRLEQVRQNCARLGVSSVEVVATPAVAPALPPAPHHGWPAALGPSRFDRVLVDAPCSNTGVLRRRLEARWRLRPEELHRLQQTQLNLLRQAVEYVRPGGVLVYSTCSLEPEENHQVAAAFVKERPDLLLESERELLPFTDGVDGAYVARFRRLVRPAG
jgi:16S rRNA (cytosine967-C5)-methyltransferase